MTMVGATPEVVRPRFAAIVKHLALSLLMANVIPSVLFYICLREGNVWTALVAAITWCYGVMAWRMRTKRPISMLLVIALVGLTAKTAFALASGSTFIYFLQPAVNDGLVSLLFLASLATARPVVARLASDFYPMSEEIAERPRIQRLFWHLTLMWAILALAKCVVTIWLLESMSTAHFVEVKSVFILSVIIGGATVTLLLAARVARGEHLLHLRPA